VAKRQSSKSKKVTCFYCDNNRRVWVDNDGVRMHSWKESNGMDYDTYTAPCAIQENLNRYRQQALTYATQRVDEAKGRLAHLRMLLGEIKKADHAYKIHHAMEQLREV